MTGAVRLWSTAFLRRRARAVLGLIVVIGLGAGFALTAAGGARRASTGWERFRAATLAPHAVFSLPENALPGTFERVAELPLVDAVAPFSFTPVAPKGLRSEINVASFVGLTDDFTTSLYRPRILAGRRPLAGRADEVTMNQVLADRTGLRVGQEVTLVSGFDPADLTDLGRVAVVGVHEGSFDIGLSAGGATLLLPAAFFRAHQANLEVGPPAAVVRLRGGDAATPRFAEQVAAIAGPGAFVISAEEEGAAIVDALRVQALALWLLAAVAGLATLVAGIQALGRVLADAGADQEVLAAMGLSPPARRALGLVPALAVGMGAAVVAAAVAVAASPLVSTGLARRVEPDRGVFVDELTLVAGVGLLLAGLAIAGLAHGRRQARARRRPDRSRPSGAHAGRVTLDIGAGWALAPARTPAGTAARSAVVAVAAGVAGVVGVATFAASLDHLYATERLYGWDFDGALVTVDGTLAGLDDTMTALTGNPSVTGLARVEVVRLSVGGHTVDAFAIDPVRGQVQPTLLAGRAPVGDDEVALGTENLERLGVAVGDVVPVDGPPPTRSLRVVGVAVFPEVGIDGDLANGALLTRTAADKLGLQRAGGLALVRVAPGVNAGKVLSRHAQGNIDAVLPFKPSRLRNMREVGAIPAVLAAFLTLLAAAAVGHALVVSVRARRRDIAVLRALGLIRGQLRTIVAVQAGVTASIGLLVGVPLGVVAGRWAWTLIANGLGVVEQPVVAWLACLATVAASLIIANLLAALPARAAARPWPAEILRTE